MPNSSSANRILADIEAKAHAAGWLKSYQAKVLVDQPNHVRVEVRFGVIANYGPPTRKPSGNQSPFIIIDQSVLVSRIAEYEYDFIDSAYNFRLAYHLHGEGAGPAESHAHHKPGLAKSSYEVVSLNAALDSFLAAYTTNRWG
jgi:hypothetical protein